MQRRDFISLLGGASAAWPLAARAQQPAMPVVGLLSPRSPAVDASLISVIRHCLNDSGFVEGQNVALDYRWADGQYDRLTALAADLVHRKVAIIVALGGEISAVAAKTATATIPIVFLAGSDPVRSGLVSRLNRPGGNITGVSSFIFDLEPKRLGLMRELRPNATTIAILLNPNSPNAEIRVNDIQIAARNVGQQVDILNASTIREIDAAFARLAQMRVDALLVAADPVFFNRASQLVVLATRHAIPALFLSARVRSGGWTHELWIECGRGLSHGWRLCRPHPQGRKAWRSTHPAADQVRAGDQSQHRPGARHRRAGHLARPRRRGDRMRRPRVHHAARWCSDGVAAHSSDSGGI